MTRKCLSLGLLLAAAVVNGCGSDASTAPTTRETRLENRVHRPSDTGIIDSDIDTVRVLRRPFSIAMDISASADIGPEGGEIKIKSAGAKIEFPAGALRQTTHITMVAKAGQYVAYEFEPHGIAFDKAVKVQQDLKYTLAYRRDVANYLTAAYYTGDLNSIFVDRRKLFARVSEVRRVDLDRRVNPRVAKFYIHHFSGYIMSSGFKGADGDSGY